MKKVLDFSHLVANHGAASDRCRAETLLNEFNNHQPCFGSTVPKKLLTTFHSFTDKIDQILDGAEKTESMVNQILYRTFTYQKGYDKALLPTGPEVMTPFREGHLEK